MRKRIVRGAALLLALLLTCGALPAARAEGAGKDINVAGLALKTGTPYTVLLTPAAGLEGSFEPVYVTMEFRSVNECDLTYGGRRVSMFRMDNRKYIDLTATGGDPFSLENDPASLLAFNGKCDTDCEGADFVVRVTDFTQGTDAVPVFGSGNATDFAPRLQTPEPAPEVRLRAGSQIIVVGETYTFRIVPDASCDVTFEPFTIPIRFFNELGVWFVTKQEGNASAVYPGSYYREDNGWIEFSSMSGKFWGKVDAGTEGADMTFRVVGLEKNLAGIFTITAVRTAPPTPTPRAETPAPARTFDTSLYLYYAMLGGEERTVYAELYQALTDCADDAALSVPISNNQVNRILWFVLYDHPDLFWATHSYTPWYENGLVKRVSLTYSFSAGDVRRERERVEAAAQRILKGTAGMNEYQAERYVHDLLAQETTYVAGSPHNQDIYSTLVNRQTVCAGYAKAFQYLMQRLGIPCCYCIGNTPSGGGQTLHAWNLVRLGGSWYNTDVTWDDWYGEKDKPFSCVTYEYYNITDSQIVQDHVRVDDSARLPACSGTSAAFDRLYGRSWQAEVAAVNGIAVVNSLEDYYGLCYDALTRTNVGQTTTSRFIVTNRATLDRIWALGETREYENAYVYPFFKTRSFRGQVYYTYLIDPWVSVSSRESCFYVVLKQTLFRK